MNNLPNNYTEQVYAGVLGKIIGVYLGRPFEGWSYDRIMAELGDTFTFLRALPDYGNSLELTPKQIGQMVGWDGQLH